MAVPADYEAANGGFTQNIEKWSKSYPFRRYEIPMRKQQKNLQVVIYLKPGQSYILGCTETKPSVKVFFFAREWRAKNPPELYEVKSASVEVNALIHPPTAKRKWRFTSWRNCSYRCGPRSGCRFLAHRQSEPLCDNHRECPA
jgi:hypothetical protein